MILDFEYKKAVIFEAFLSFYKEIQKNSAIDIPYFMYAKKAYNENIKSAKDVNKWYKNICSI